MQGGIKGVHLLAAGPHPASSLGSLRPGKRWPGAGVPGGSEIKVFRSLGEFSLKNFYVSRK